MSGFLHQNRRTPQHSEVDGGVPVASAARDGTLGSPRLEETQRVIAGALGTVEILILLALGGGIPLTIGVFTYRAGFNAGLAKGRAEALERLSGR